MAVLLFVGPGDKVQCFQCGGNLRDWEPEDDPWEEHKRWYANCAYIKNNFPAPRRQFQEPVPQMVSDRKLQVFENNIDELCLPYTSRF